MGTHRTSIPERRRQIARICESLPEVEVEDEGRHVGFRVRQKRFAWYLEDHHGDGRISLHCKAEIGANEVLATSSPDRYFIPPYLGPRGWIGFWLDVPTLDWREAAELIVDSYRLVAPKRLAEMAEKRSLELAIDSKDPD